MLSHLWGCKPPRTWLAECLGLAVSTKGADQAFWAGVEQRAASFCLEGEPQIASMPRRRSSGLTSRRRRPHCRGQGVKPALEFPGHGRPATLGMIGPKSQHKSLAQAGSARRLPTRQAPPGSREQRRVVRGGGPVAGLRGTRADGPSGLQGAGRGERQPTQGCGLPGEASSSSAFVSGQQVDHSPDSLRGIPEEGVAGASCCPWLLLSGGAAAHRMGL